MSDSISLFFCKILSTVKYCSRLKKIPSHYTPLYTKYHSARARKSFNLHSLIYIVYQIKWRYIWKKKWGKVLITYCCVICKNVCIIIMQLNFCNFLTRFFLRICSFYVENHSLRPSWLDALLKSLFSKLVPWVISGVTWACTNFHLNFEAKNEHAVLFQQQFRY